MSNFCSLEEAYPHMVAKPQIGYRESPYQRKHALRSKELEDQESYYTDDESEPNSDVEYIDSNTSHYYRKPSYPPRYVLRNHREKRNIQTQNVQQQSITAEEMKSLIKSTIDQSLKEKEDQKKKESKNY